MNKDIQVEFSAEEIAHIQSVIQSKKQKLNARLDRYAHIANVVAKQCYHRLPRCRKEFTTVELVAENILWESDSSFCTTGKCAKSPRMERLMNELQLIQMNMRSIDTLVTLNRPVTLRGNLLHFVSRYHNTGH